MTDRRLVLSLCAALLVSAALAGVTVARYEALRDSVLDACPTAAQLDLSSLVDACKLVGYQQLAPEDLER